MQISKTDPTLKAKATKPQPRNGTTIGLTSVSKLKWKAGVNAKSHKVYFGTKSDELPLLAEVQRPSYDELPELEEGAKYYWRIDEVWSDGTVIDGDVWNFTTGKLVGWWKLDNDAKDSSRNGYHGTVNGDPNWVAGQVGSALELDGVDDYVQTPDDITKLQLTGSYSFSVWIRADATQNSWAGIFSKCNPSGSINHWTLQFDGSSPRNLIIFHPDDLPPPQAWNTGIQLPDVVGASHHIGIVRSGNTMTSYLDGVPRKTGTWNNNPGSGDGHLNIGVDRTATHDYVYKGLIDDVRVYNYALSKDEITALYNEGK